MSGLKSTEGAEEEDDRDDVGEEYDDDDEDIDGEEEEKEKTEDGVVKEDVTVEVRGDIDASFVDIRREEKAVALTAGLAGLAKEQVEGLEEKSFLSDVMTVG